MSNESRIKLAEAMGWQWIEYSNTPFDGMGRWFSPEAVPESEDNHYGYRICGSACPPIFDPFTDANDDYAVLEWMRQNEIVREWRKIDELACCTYYYQIGDYARAALKVLT